LFLFLTGGPPQLDTFDLKPEAPADVRGELKPIATSVPGLQFGELCPLLAKEAYRFCVVRSVTHTDTVHTSAGYTMLTGAVHPLLNSPGGAANVRPTPNDHPHLGALLAKARPAKSGAPTFASLPEVIKDAAVNEFPGQSAGFLGKVYDPFRIEPAEGGFALPEIVLPDNVNLERLADRRGLLKSLNRAGGPVGTRAAVDERDRFSEKAVELLRSTTMRQAFNLGRETAATRTGYGDHRFGQGCLLARRLLEAGVSLVTVYWHYEGPDDSPVWDTHWNNFAHLRKRLLPPTDQAVAFLIQDLANRGLLEDTLLLCLGEFGRTPKINKFAGRDHWPHAQSILLAGAGVPAGAVYGSTDKHAAYPAENPVSPQDLAATILHLLGVPPDLELRDRTGRPLAATSGKPVSALLH
jgi:hypothetical protein